MKYIETFKEIKDFKSIGLRRHVRTLVLNSLSILDKIRGLQKDLDKPRVQFLYIHHVFKDEEKRFDILLNKLSLNHNFISHSDAITKILDGKIDKPYISISSDDGIKNNVRAAEILNKYGVKACFFINPIIIGETNYEKIKSHCKERIHFPPVEFLNWKDIEQLQKMGHEFGSHTMQHINIAKTSKDLIVDDCNKTFEILKSRCGEAKHFAFPYGRFCYFSEIGRKAVFESGFTSCASAERGCHMNYGKKILYEELCILRDIVILDWNLDHIFYFLANNSRNNSTQKSIFSYNKR